jgi:hypothetical protein
LFQVFQWVMTKTTIGSARYYSFHRDTALIFASGMPRPWWWYLALSDTFRHSDILVHLPDIFNAPDIARHCFSFFSSSQKYTLTELMSCISLASGLTGWGHFLFYTQWTSSWMSSLRDHIEADYRPSSASSSQA